MVPNGWFTYKFSEIVKETQLGTTERHKGEFCSDPIPLLKMGNLSWGGFNLKSLETLPRSRVDESLILKKGDFLFNTRNTPELVGKSAVWNGELTEAIFDNNINRIVFHNSIDPFYLGLYLNNGRGKSVINSLPAGSTSVAAIYWKDLKNIKLTLPPLPEQKKIAQILSTWDKAIATTEKLIATSQQQKKALMQQLLTGKKRLLDKNGVRFSGDWNALNLGEILSKVSNGVTYDAKNVEGLPVTRIETISTGKVNFNKVGFAPDEENTRRFKLHQGDILYSHINSLEHIGRVAYFNDARPLYHGMNLLLLRTGEKHDSLYIYYLLGSELGKKYAKSYAKSAVNQASISTTDVKAFRFLIPNLPEQQKIASVLTAADKEIELLQAKLAHLKDEKKALMQQLLTGKRRVKVDENVAA
ncbi:TPA: restriction endonuclease subunit S [Proteus mirabilis]|uniref:restriction endonuclease subunit S n=1 Tax=Providencia stuartii TaxID=588 RepID=UPI00073BBDF6|nr:restriction endonuclease subunit S [Providencia stuartii]KSX95269.1 hypothetical protein APT95_04155 [Providencia stuartii]MBI6306555.1 restriction endonuclease subunit S [Proteus mirabilis]HEN8201410.1 restriction endonuclease subunit S [Proteus mirabilis]